MNKQIIIKISAFLFVLGGTGYALYGAIQPSVVEKTSQKKITTTDHSKMTRMVTYVKPKVYAGTKSAITSYLGEIQTEKNGQIYPYRAGIIEAYLVNVGDSVKKGQVVARLLPAEYSPDIANMIADRKAERTRSAGMVASAKLTLENAKKISERTMSSTSKQLDATVIEQDAKISKLVSDLASVDVQISTQERTIENMKKTTDASVALESDKLGLRETTVKTAIKNAHAILLRVFYGASSSLSNTSALKNTYFGAKNTSLLTGFAASMSSLHAKYQNIDSLSRDESFVFAREVAETLDRGIKILDATIVSSDYDETMLNSDKTMLIEAKTDSMYGLLTVLNMYEEQKSMLTKETSVSSGEYANERLMLERLRAEREVAVKDLAMAQAEKERMIAETENMKSSSENDASKMVTEAEKMLIDANANLSAATEALGVLESAGFSNEVRSPFAGKITRRNINVGESIAMGTPLYDIIGTDSKKSAPKSFVRFEIPETDLGDATIGKEVRFYKTAEPLRKLVAKIARVSPAVGSASKGVIIEAEFAENTKNIPIGSTVRVEMEKAGNMLLIPSSSVVQYDNGDLSVFTIDSKEIVRSKPVSTERTVGLEVYISSGVVKNDRIIELPKNYAFLEDGIKVDPMEKPTVATPTGAALSVPDEHKNH